MFKTLLALLLGFFAAATFAATEVNTASPAELDAIKGIGPSTASKIMDERKKAPFKDWTDFVTRVKGVGDKNAAGFSAAGLTVNGASINAAGTAPAAARTPGAKSTAVGTSPMPGTPAAAVAPPATSTAAAPNASPASPTGAVDRKAAAKQERDDKRAAKKAAKAASAGQPASAPARK